MSKIIDVMFKVIINIIMGIVGLVILAILCKFIATTMFEEKYVDVFGYSYLRVNTDSLEPSLNSNDILIIKNTDEFEEDSVISYLDYYDNIMTNRVISSNNSHITINNDTDDDISIQKEDVIGKAIFVIPFPFQILFIIFVISLIIASKYFLPNIKKNGKRKNTFHESSDEYEVHDDYIEKDYHNEKRNINESSDFLANEFINNHEIPNNQFDINEISRLYGIKPVNKNSDIEIN